MPMSEIKNYTDDLLKEGCSWVYHLDLKNKFVLAILKNQEDLMGKARCLGS